MTRATTPTTPTPPAARAPRKLDRQFARTYPDRPCCLTSDEMQRYATSQRGGYAPWRMAGLAHLAATDRGEEAR